MHVILQPQLSPCPNTYIIEFQLILMCSMRSQGEATRLVHSPQDRQDCHQQQSGHQCNDGEKKQGSVQKNKAWKSCTHNQLIDIVTDKKRIAT